MSDGLYCLRLEHVGRGGNPRSGGVYGAWAAAIVREAGIYPKPWVARILGTDPKYGLEREFVDSTEDCSASNRTGSRGIYRVFWLRPGYYEVSARNSWSRAERYFCEVRAAECRTCDSQEVLAWAAARDSA